MPTESKSTVGDLTVSKVLCLGPAVDGEGKKNKWYSGHKRLFILLRYHSGLPFLTNLPATRPPPPFPCSPLPLVFSSLANYVSETQLRFSLLLQPIWPPPATPVCAVVISSPDAKPWSPNWAPCFLLCFC